MHRRRSVLIDAWLVSNLVMVAGLAVVCVMVGLFTDWRWAGLLAGVLAFVGAAYYQWDRAGADGEPAKRARPSKPA